MSRVDQRNETFEARDLTSKSCLTANYFKQIDLKKKLPVGVSARHVHLNQEALEALYGKGYQLSIFKELSQTGQYAAVEKVILCGPKKQIKDVRILGPLRKESQVEISVTDAWQLGITPPVRNSGDLEDSASITIVGPCGVVKLEHGCIIAQRHIHMTPKDAQIYGVTDSEEVSIKVDNAKGGILEHVIVRVREDYRLELHIDTDDANAFLIKDKDQVTLIRSGH